MTFSSQQNMAKQCSIIFIIELLWDWYEAKHGKAFCKLWKATKSIEFLEYDIILIGLAQNMAVSLTIL